MSLTSGAGKHQAPRMTRQGKVSHMQNRLSSCLLSIRTVKKSGKKPDKAALSLPTQTHSMVILSMFWNVRENDGSQEANKQFEMNLRLSHRLVIAKPCCHWTDPSNPDITSVRRSSKCDPQSRKCDDLKSVKQNHGVQSPPASKPSIWFSAPKNFHTRPKSLRLNDIYFEISFIKMSIHRSRLRHYNMLFVASSNS